MNYQADVETSVFVISCWCLDSSKRSWLRNLQASFCIQNYFTEVNSRQHLSANTVQSCCCWWWAKQLPFSLKSNSSAVYLLVSVQLRPLQQTVMHLYYTLWPLNKLVEFSLTYYIQSQPESRKLSSTTTTTTLWVKKKQDTKLFAITLPTIIRFSIFFH